MGDVKFSYYETSAGYRIAGKSNDDVVLAGGGTANASSFANENVKIGGRNLFENSKNKKKTKLDDLSSLNQFWWFQNLDIDVDPKLKVGDLVTISFDIEMDVGTYLNVYDSEGNGLKNIAFGSKIFTNIGSQKQRLEWNTIVTANTGTVGTHQLCFYNGSNGDKFSIENIKIEKGNKASAWFPAPEDLISDWNMLYSDDFSYIKNKPINLVSTDSFGNITITGHRITTSEISIGEIAGKLRITNNGYEEFYFLGQSNGFASLKGLNFYTPYHGDSTQWNAAYNWGNHASAGYATPTWTNSNFIPKSHPIFLEGTQANIDKWNNNEPVEFVVDPTSLVASVDTESLNVTVIGYEDDIQTVNVDNIYRKQTFKMINLATSDGMEVNFPNLSKYTIDAMSKVTFYVSETFEVIFMDKSATEIWV